jgi:transposase
LGKWDIHTYPIKLIKRVRIVKRADGFYVQFCVDTEIKQEPRIADGEVGLDVGLEHFYSDSNGHHEPNPRFLRKAEKSIKLAVTPHYTSQKCSDCGAIVKKSLSTRTHKCSCGCELQRDVNAAVNILNLAKQARGGHPQSNATGVGISTLVGENLLEQILT